MKMLLARCGQLLILAFAIVGLITTGRYTYDLVREHFRTRPVVIPISKLPGPPRETGTPSFELVEGNSQRMIGIEDFRNARWFDIDDNVYSRRLINDFRYEDTSPVGPEVRIRIDGDGDTLRGRLEGHRLKPNFAYQIKLRGVYDHRESFEIIGQVGRWRLPGWGTNFSDEDYQRYPEKSKAEAYLLFDFFVTDRRGSAVRNFELDSTLHVLWKAEQRTNGVPRADMVACLVDASDPNDYMSPASETRAQWIWAEREHRRYSHPDQVTSLPPRSYYAELVLTEESFHSSSYAGGYWATVLRCPITFSIAQPNSDRRKK